MVAFPVIHARKLWLKYVTLSLLAHGLLLSLLASSPATLIAEEMPTLKVNLLAIAKATAATHEPPLARHGKKSDITQEAQQGNHQSHVISEAKYRKQVPPIYPRRAQELGQQGTVTLHVEVTPVGLPRELNVAQSSGYHLLDRAALTAVKQWEFEPTHLGDDKITSWVRVPVRFVIRQ